MKYVIFMIFVQAYHNDAYHLSTPHESLPFLTYHHQIFPQWVGAHHGGGFKLIEPVNFKAGGRGWHSLHLVRVVCPDPGRVI